MSAWVVPGYTEERELGRGASARVVAATRNDSGQQVAIKYLAPRLFRDPNLLARFREEVELLQSLDVPQVVRLFDYVEVPGPQAGLLECRRRRQRGGGRNVVVGETRERGRFAQH